MLAEISRNCQLSPQTRVGSAAVPRMFSNIINLLSLRTQNTEYQHNTFYLFLYVYYRGGWWWVVDGDYHINENNQGLGCFC